jgi:hypothetical protein
MMRGADERSGWKARMGIAPHGGFPQNACAMRVHARNGSLLICGNRSWVIARIRGQRLHNRCAIYYPYWYGSNSPWTWQASASSHPAYYGGSGGYAYHPAYGFGY